VGGLSCSHTGIQVAVLVQLKMFQTIGRFRRATDIPAIVFEHVDRRLGVEFGPAFVHPDRTLYRHRPAILKHLGVTPWGAAARELAQFTMIMTAKPRTDPADVINAAVDALIWHRFELPALVALCRLAGTAHSKVNAAQWGAVCGYLDEAKQSALEAILVVDPTIQQSPFADLCHAANRMLTSRAPGVPYPIGFRSKSIVSADYHQSSIWRGLEMGTAGWAAVESAARMSVTRVQTQALRSLQLVWPSAPFLVNLRASVCRSRNRPSSPGMTTD
jgi:hypothetical protein